MSMGREAWDEGAYERDLAIERYEMRQVTMQTALEKGVWIQKGGSEIPIKQMTDSHIKNCIRMIKNSDNFKYDDISVERKYVGVFEKELKNRERKYER